MSEPNLDFVPNDDDFPEEVEINIPPTAEADYQAYLSVANGPDKPFGEPPLSFDDFVIINYMESLSKAQKLAKLGFVVPSSVSPRSIADAVGTINDVIDVAQQVGESVRTTRSRIADLNNRVRGGNRIVDIVSPPPGGGGGGGMRKSSDGPHHSVNLVSLAPSPVQVKLDTGIQNLIYGPYANYCDTYNSPLHLSGFQLNVPGSNGAGLFITSIFDSTVTTNFQILSQQAVTFNLSANSVFSAANLRSYFYSMGQALSYFYFFSSVISFTNNRNNPENAGMEALRSYINADDINEFWLLKDVLNRYPIPPNINHLAFYLFQSYSSSELPNSPLLKLFPFSFVATTDINNKFSDVDFATVFNNIRTTLITDTLRNVAGMLNKVCPGWMADGLMSPIDTPVYDTQFLTLWQNLPHFGNYTGGVVHRWPTVTNLSDEIPFFTKDNDIDGAIIGMLSSWNSSNNDWIPSLLKIIVSPYASSRYSNRVSFQLIADGTKAFAPSSNVASVAISRGETCAISAVEYKYQPFGTEVVKGLCGNVSSQAAANLLNWMMTYDSLGSGVSDVRNKSVPKAKHVNVRSSGKEGKFSKGRKFGRKRDK